MTSIIKFTLKELNTLINDANSCVSKQSVTQNIAFQPWCLSNMKDSVEKILDYKIGKFDKDLDGIILSYKNVKILDDLCAIRQDSSEIYSDVQADLFVFQPRVGATLHGVINKTSVTHLGILVHRVFNVVIPRPSNEPGNKWIGAQLSVGQKISFKIVVLDLFGALPYIRGCLDENSLPIEDLDNPHTGDETDDLVSHVNFAGTKPKSAKPANTVKKSPKTVSSPYSVKVEPGTSNKKTKKVIPKKYAYSDSDSISDVDEELMQTQTSLIEKIMSRDKCQRASGVKPSFAENSIGIKKIDKTKPAKTSFIDVRKLKTNKNLNKPSENINTTLDKTTKREDLNHLKSKSIFSPAVDKKPSKIIDDFDNISVIAKSPKKHNALDDSTLVIPSPKKHSSVDQSSVMKSPKNPKSLGSIGSKRKTKVNGNQNNNISVEVKNATGDSLLTTSTPFPTTLEKTKKNSSQKEHNDVVEIKDSKKKLSFSNVSSDNLISSSNDATLESKEINSKKAKLSKKLKQDSDSFVNTNNSSQNEDFDTDFSQSSSKSKKFSKKKPVSDYDSTSSVIMNTPPIVKSNIFQKHPAIVDDIKKSRIDCDLKLGSTCGSLSKKRKRKSSDSSITMSGIASDETHQSDVSNTVPHRKKRRKNNETNEPQSQDGNSEVHFLPPANVDGNTDGDLSSSDQKKHKKKKAESSQESHNGNSTSSFVKVESSGDETRSKKKHVKKLERHKSICAQEILAQIESNPSLLEEIQLLLKSRVTNQVTT